MARVPYNAASQRVAPSEHVPHSDSGDLSNPATVSASAAEMDRFFRHMQALRSAHQSEQSDMNGNYLEAMRRMNVRHEKQIRDLTNQHLAALGSVGSGGN